MVTFVSEIIKMGLVLMV